jgi:hypothetical protein
MKEEKLELNVEDAENRDIEETLDDNCQIWEMKVFTTYSNLSSAALYFLWMERIFSFSFSSLSTAFSQLNFLELFLFLFQRLSNVLQFVIGFIKLNSEAVNFLAIVTDVTISLKQKFSS